MTILEEQIVLADGWVNAIIIICVGIGIATAVYYAWITMQIPLDPKDKNYRWYIPDDERGAGKQRLLDSESGNHTSADGGTTPQKIYDITNAIREGAKSFLYREYLYLFIFLIIFSIIILLVLGSGRDSTWLRAFFTMLAFLFGSGTSILSGYIGMRIAVEANGRTALKAREGVAPAFNCAFMAGGVMGFGLVALGVFVLFVIINIWYLYFDGAFHINGQETTINMMSAIAGYGLGGSTVALFGRVGGGIYTKAADVGADLVGKLEFKIPEDDPRNPATIADNVGDNVGDVAGMGADLFGSFAESSCAALVLSAEGDLFFSYVTMMVPLLISSLGLISCYISSLFSTHCFLVEKIPDLEKTLKRQIFLSTALNTPIFFVLCWLFLPATFAISGHEHVHNWYVFFCIICGLWSGCIIGFVTDYYTSNYYAPVKELAHSCYFGAATNIIYGLALGMKSVIIPMFCIAITVFITFALCGMYGIAVAALGILSTLAIGLTIDAYGPIADNAGGIAEMSDLGEGPTQIVDAMDASGNTTAAIGKGFAISSAALVSLALFGAFIRTVKLTEVDVLEPFQFAGLIIGAMLPYWFTSLTMKSVGKAALKMVEEIRRQFIDVPGIIAGTETPDYSKCIRISTDAAIKEMIPPGCLVMFTPLIVGFLFGPKPLAGVLAGALASGIQLATSSANSGGAWDNAKKYIEQGNLVDPRQEKVFDEVHDASIIGDTVGDPLKDTSGPSLNILIKLSAIISLVFAPALPDAEKGGYLVQLFS